MSSACSTDSPIARARRVRRARRGSVLVVVVLMLAFVAAVTLALSQLSHDQSRVSSELGELGRTALVADNGLARGRARLEAELVQQFGQVTPDVWNMPLLDPNDASTELAWFTTPEGAQVRLACLESAANTRVYRLRSRAAQPGDRAPRRVELIVRVALTFATTPLRGPGVGAIVGFGNINVGGNFHVDGRNYEQAWDPFSVGGPNPNVGTLYDTYKDTSGASSPGITSTGNVSRGGNAHIGGEVDGTSYGTQKSTTAADSGTSVWTDGVDLDGDGTPDMTSAPSTVDAYLSLPDGGLRSMAIAGGTHFTTLAAYNAYVNDAANDVSGKVLYLEVANGSSVGTIDLPDNPWPKRPAIVVVAGQDRTVHDTSVGPVHANNSTFQGMFMADRIVNMNGNGALLGQVVSFNTVSASGSIGNGTFNVYFSRKVLADLPSGGANGGQPSSGDVTVEVWRELAPN